VSPPLLILAIASNPFHRDTASDRVVPALIVTAVFGIVAYLLRGVTLNGALAGTFSAFVIYIGLGSSGFVTLMAVFFITLICTRIGVGKKRQLGLAENRRGRNAAQVLANVGIATVFAALALRNPWLAVGSVAAMAEAAADTTQSEIGEIASQRAWLITTFREVPPGTDGGITLAGLSAGALAAAAVALVAHFTSAVDPSWAGIAGVGGFLGTIVDSLLGATLERRGWLTNNAVNFLSTLAASALSIALLFVFLG
jgi:uncharacterized protein (TIGR00297 family)